MICRRCGKDVVGTNKCLYCGKALNEFTNGNDDIGKSTSQNGFFIEQETNTSCNNLYEIYEDNSSHKAFNKHKKGTLIGILITIFIVIAMWAHIAVLAKTLPYEIMHKRFRTALIIIILLWGWLVIYGAIIMHRNKNYRKLSRPVGEIEQKYTAMGEFDISYMETKAKTTEYKKYEIWYPAELEHTNKKYPLVIIVNSTPFFTACRFKEVFKHLASWGFIVVGNEDTDPKTGASSAETLDFMLEKNKNSKSIFWGKIDINNIGIAGHFQGGIGAINAVTNQENGNCYKAIWTASTISKCWNNVLGSVVRYDTSKLTIPTFMVAGTGKSDAGKAGDSIATKGQGICPLWSMIENYNSIPEGTPKVMARLIGKNTIDMLRSADGYMTAWFMHYLKGNEYAGNAFFGEHAEIRTNSNWQDVKINK